MLNLIESVTVVWTRKLKKWVEHKTKTQERGDMHMKGPHTISIYANNAFETECARRATLAEPEDYATTDGPYNQHTTRVQSVKSVSSLLHTYRLVLLFTARDGLCGKVKPPHHLQPTTYVPPCPSFSPFFAPI